MLSPISFFERPTEISEEYDKSSALSFPETVPEIVVPSIF